jgi:hypothetical protein
MSPAAKRDLPTSGLSPRNWRSIVSRRLRTFDAEVAKLDLGHAPIGMMEDKQAWDRLRLSAAKPMLFICIDGFRSAQPHPAE